LKLKSGKLPWRLLEELLALLPTKDIDLIMGPSIGEDAAVIRFKDGFLVVHTDPITAASRRIGWLAVHIAANDIAVRGARPKWFLPTILLPKDVDESLVRDIFSDMAQALRELDAVAVGGHTEVTPELTRPIISMTAMGYAHDKIILTRDARPGDKVLIIGRVGGEGASIIAWDFRDLLLEKNIDRDLIEEAKNYLWDISVVDKALSIKSYVNSMHDPTEGGILQGLREVALASGTSILIDLDRLTISECVRAIAEAVGLDPLRLLSSGALIATVPEERLAETVDVLESRKYPYTVCGHVQSGDPGKVFLMKNNKIVDVIDYDITDEIYKLWETI